MAGAGGNVARGLRVPNWMLKSALAILAALLALAAVRLEGHMREWAHGRPMLPLIMLLVGTTLLNPRLRSQVIIGMCFGVAFMAVRDSFHTHLWNVPFTMDRSLVDAMILAALLVIAVLSVAAGVMETITPGCVGARRLYFCAAALYCVGLGVRYFGEHGTLQSVVLCGTGLMAGMASLFANRIVASGRADAVREGMSDEAEQRLRDAEHLRALRDKEWQDPDSHDASPAV